MRIMRLVPVKSAESKESKENQPKRAVKRFLSDDETESIKEKYSKFSCMLCNVNFTRKDNLQRHVKYVHTGKDIAPGTVLDQKYVDNEVESEEDGENEVKRGKDITPPKWLEQKYDDNGVESEDSEEEEEEDSEDSEEEEDSEDVEVEEEEEIKEEASRSPQAHMLCKKLIYGGKKGLLY